MNKNKLIFLWILGVIWFLIFLVFLIIRSDAKEEVRRDGLDIWTLWHTPSDFASFIEQYQFDTWVSLNYSQRNFESYDDYKDALLLELVNDDGPDVFMLNNSEPLLLIDRIAWIEPSYINPEEFRKNYLSPFPEELIDSVEDDGQKIDYLLWVPAGFEVLGLYYDRRSFVGQDLKTWSWVSEAIKDIKEVNDDITPIWIWAGVSVYDSQDIFSQFLVNSGSRWILDLDTSTMRSALATYKNYANDDWDNDYNEVAEELTPLWKNNISLFSTWNIKMLVGYPSIINKIADSGFSKNFLSAEPFPKSTSLDDKLLLNYNFFVINSETDSYNGAASLLSYMTTNNWADAYYDVFTGKLPSHGLIEDRLDQKFHPDFNISYKNVLRDQIELVTYNKWIKNIFDAEMPHILDMEDVISAGLLMSKLQANINCKIQTLNWDNDINPNCKK